MRNSRDKGATDYMLKNSVKKVVKKCARQVINSNREVFDALADA
jgi:hypothetical protein